MNVRSFRVQAVLCSLLLSLACGCGGGDEGPTLHAVTGKLTDGAEPLSNVIVTFTPTDVTQPASFGTTSDDGSFELRTGPGKAGAVSGQHKVSLAVATDESAYASSDDPASAATLPFPETYKSPESTPMEVAVEEGDNSISVDLSE